ncbi:ATP-binding protein [Nitratireductor sp. GCM10026969]|uniref:PAS domain-containing sensor histidine kinase n=1 Tax=Nitratireductor sp. GCM10026969 TaxID=3252645 RepID=UPI0036243642
MPGLNPLSGGISGPQARRKRRDRLSARLVRAPLPAVALAATAIGAAAAEHEIGLPLGGSLSVGTLEVIQLASFAGVMGAALLSAIWLIRQRARISAENIDLRTRIAELSGALSRSEALLNLRDQRIVVWPGDGGRPSVVGELPIDSGAPRERSTFLAFGRWLMPKSASALDRAAEALRDRGEGFDLVAETRAGILLEVQGRKSALHAVIRFSSLSAAQAEHARLKLAHERLKDDHANLLGLVNALDMPFWLRDEEGRLKWVNAAYARAVEADPEQAVREIRELLPTPVRTALQEHHRHDGVYRDSVSTVVGGDRCVYTVTDFATGKGSAGIAVDTSEADALKREFERTVRSHADTLDQLTTAVAIFDEHQKLKFFNQAFQKLWDLEPGFLDGGPENALVLDRLRSDGKLAEQPEWRRWKEQLLSAYRAVEPEEHWWHLPDGRTIRVIANPQPKGGVTWVFENLTEKFDLESRYNAVVQVQSETLDNLAEGVAVFGPDGRLRLSNPAFRRLWELPEKLIDGDVHISLLKAACDAVANPSPWSDFVAAATGFDDERRDSHGRTELVNGTNLSYAIIHLPNGQVMMTFVDVTDSVNVERALKEKNEALEKADKLKNDFVQHVSYELRSPLTNIIGFTELLALETTGPLGKRQREYVDHIGSSSSLLLTVVNDILDLATVDAGIMELEFAEVPIRPTVEAAADLVSDRLREHGITLDLDLDAAPAAFHADENRIRQILYNLLSNAANYAPEGGRVSLTVTEAGEAVAFRVHDNGPGMSPEMLQTIFRRFEPRSNGGRRRGAGLGLSIVKSFVELHGGTVEIDTGEGRGTAVTCRFPLAPTGVREAAE